MKSAISMFPTYFKDNAIMIRKKLGGPMDFQGGRDHSLDRKISFLSKEGVSQDQINHS